MKQVLLSIVVLMVVSSVVFANSAPNVSSVTASQRADGSGIVDIYYRLTDADNDVCTVTVVVSDDDGSTWTITPTSFSSSSAIGEVVPSPGAKKIIWYSKVDLPGKIGNFLIKVFASDGVASIPNGPIPASDFVKIEGGSFLMGDHYEIGLSDELPVHSVELSSFYISKYEVTDYQYREFLEDGFTGGLLSFVGYDPLWYSDPDGVFRHNGNDCYAVTSASRIRYKPSIRVLSPSNHPVTQVSWLGAKLFCDQYGYSLPTEAQWEYAAHGGDIDNSYFLFPWNDNIIDDTKCNYNKSNPDGWTIYPYTTRVGRYGIQGNYGLCDMAGNIQEWCADWYAEDYYSNSPVVNPKGPPTGTYRILKGGDWYNGAMNCRIASRNYDELYKCYVNVGFRVCLEIPETAKISNDFAINNRFDFPVYDLEDDSLLGYVVELCGSDADPVNTATGNFYHDETDITIATRSVPLQFNRHYNSMDTKNGPLGIGWTHSYNITLTSGLGPDTNRVAVRWGDGRTNYWIDNGAGSYDPDMPGLNDTLEQVSSNWKLTRKNLDVYLFDSTSKLQSITDKNGNAFTLGYDGSSRLATVTDPASRVVTFAYNPDGTLQRSTDMSGRVNQYEYSDGRLTRVIDPLGNTTSYEYDASGYLSTITDSRGIVTITNVYNAEGRVVNQTDGKGIVTTFAYGTENEFKKTTITYTDGTSNNHLHSENNLLLMIRYPQGSVSYAYDDEMNRTQIIDRNGNVTDFEYDARNNVTKTTDPNDLDDENDGGFTVFEYNNAGFPDLPTKKIDVLGRVTTWEYDSKGNCIKETDALGNMTVWTYNSFGQKLTETDKNGNTRMYEYASEGQLMKVIDASGNETTFSYDALWRIVNVTNALGNVTSTVYDNLDRIIQVTGPISTVRYEYDSVGNLIREINPNGNATTYAYDANKNLVTTTDALGNTTTYTYDGLNRRITTTNANGNTTQYSYDDMGRLTTETDPLGNERILTYDAKGNILTETDGSDVTISYEYDSLNRLVKQTDGLGNSQTWEYDKSGHLIKSTDALSNASQYQYDSLSRLTSVTDPKELSTQYQYDSMGRVTLVKDTGGKTINSKTYDALGTVVSKADGNSNSSTYGYDALGNLISLTDANGNTTNHEYDAESKLIRKVYHDSSQVVYAYDTNGNLLNTTDSTGTTTFTYDAMDRLISSTDSFSKTVQYTYDSVGNRISIVYPANSTKPARTVTYSHDNANRLDTITDWDSRVWDYTLDEAGRMTKLTYPNGMERLHEYDEAGRLSNLQYKNSTDADVITYEYTRDALGNPVNVNETGLLLPDVTSLTKNLQMDFDADNRLTEANGEPYAYDNIGNVTAINKGGQTTNLTYNSENRLTSQTTGASTVQHVYNGLNNRTARIDNGTETRYVLNYGMDMSHVLL